MNAEVFPMHCLDWASLLADSLKQKKACFPHGQQSAGGRWVFGKRL